MSNSPTVQRFNSALATVETGLNAITSVLEILHSENAKLMESLNREISEKKELLEKISAIRNENESLKNAISECKQKSGESEANVVEETRNLSEE